MAVKISIGTQLNFGDVGSDFGSRTAVGLTTSQTSVLSQGFWLVEAPANSGAKVAYTPDKGTSTITFATGASFKAVVFSDGFNWWIDAGGTAGTFQVTQIKAMF